MMGVPYLMMGKFNHHNFYRCSATCAIESFWRCSGGSSLAIDSCAEICGDGVKIQASTTRCDDGNSFNGDG